MKERLENHLLEIRKLFGEDVQENEMNIKGGMTGLDSDLRRESRINQ